MQNMMGTTLDVYKHWTQKNGMPYLVEEIGEDARLLWFGERQLDNVVLYIHGVLVLVNMISTCIINTKAKYFIS